MFVFVSVHVGEVSFTNFKSLKDYTSQSFFSSKKDRLQWSLNRGQNCNLNERLLRPEL